MIETIEKKNGGYMQVEHHFICPVCKSKLDTYAEAEVCFKECCEAHFGQIAEVVEEAEEEYMED